MHENQRQQGDVNLEKLACLPQGEEFKTIEPRNGHIILAEGEFTGHFHGIEEAEGIKLVEGQDGSQYLVNEVPATIKHQEHKPITLEPGIWEIGQTYEYDYLQEMNRFVAD